MGPLPIRENVMGYTLESVLDDLREDHRNMSTLLDLLEHETSRLRDGDDPDFDLLLDVMRYMTVYADAVHHPKEDLVYARMRASSDELDTSLDSIEQDHDDIAELGNTLRTDISAIVSGVAVKRSQVLDDTRSYADRLRRHMAWEDRELFPKADALAQRPDIELEGDIFASRDPAFGSAREASFDNLLKAINLSSQQ